MFTLSEWVAHRKVECRIALPVWRSQRPAFLILRRIIGFHSEVEAQQKICEIKT